MDEFQKADPQARRRLFAWLGLLIAGGIVLLAMAETGVSVLTTWVVADASHHQQRLWLVMGLLTLALVAPLWIVAVYLWRMGQQIVRDRRFPPCGSVTVRDVKIRRGPAALAYGRTLKALAVALALAGAVTALLLGQLTLLLGGS